LPSVIPQLYSKYRSLHSIKDTEALPDDFICSSDQRSLDLDIHSLPSSSASSASGFLSTSLTYDSSLKDSLPLCEIDIIRITSSIGSSDSRSSRTTTSDAEETKDKKKDQSKVKEISIDKFLKNYVHKKRPVVIRGLIEEENSATHWSYSSLMSLGEHLKVVSPFCPVS
jgi:hypothetical protein